MNNGTRSVATAVAVTLLVCSFPGMRLAAQDQAMLPHVIGTSERVIEGRHVVERDEFAGLRAREWRCVERACSGRWFDGRRVYAIDANETPIPLDAEVSELEASVQAVTSMAYAQTWFRAAGGSTEPAGSARVRVRAPGGRSVTVTLDPATRLPARIDDDEGEPVATLGDYRRVGTLVLPFRIARPGSLLRYDARTVEPSPLVAPPGLGLRLAGGTAATFTGRFPILPCTLAGRALHCLLDSGSTGLSLAVRTSEALRLRPFGEAEVAGLRRFATALVETGPLTVAGATVEHARFTLIADPPPDAEVILGVDFFEAATVAIDYPARRVTLLPEGTGNGNARTLNVSYHGLRAELPIALGAFATRLVVDTGDGAGIDVPYAVYRTHADAFVLAGRGGASGVGGTSDVLTGEVREVTLAGERIPHVPLWVTRSLPEERGRIGSQLLARYRVFFDLAHDRITLAVPAG